MASLLSSGSAISREFTDTLYFLPSIPFHSIPFLHLFALRNFSRDSNRREREKEYFGIPFPGKIGGKNSAGRNCGGWVDRWIGGTIISTSLPPCFDAVSR